MAFAKTFKIKESELALKKLIKSNDSMLSKRLRALLVFKQNEQEGISKREVAKQIGVDHNSIQTWRSAYIKGGIDLLLQHAMTGYKPSKINKKQEEALRKQLNNPSNGIVGFIELLDWFNKTYNTTIKYKTFHGFVVRKFNAKVKVARKVHVKKDAKAVKTLKKTLTASAKKLSQKK